MRRMIRLLGEPAVYDATGRIQEVRGHKAWALLARILMARGPLHRRSLAEELFSEADDPLGSLRSSLAALRKAIGSPDCFVGDPVVGNIPKDVDVDVLNLYKDDFDVELAGTLLEGIEPRSGPGFSTWLLVERERMASHVESRIKQEAIRAIAIRDHRRAVRLAEIAVRHSTFDEGAHVLLVKGLILAGRYKAALKHVDATEALFLQELGERPSLALRSAARRTASSTPGGVSQTAVIKSMIESGVAALSAGATDAGIDNLRRAVDDASNIQDHHLHSKALLELGTALIHSARGFAEEGAVFLSQSAELARRRGYASIAATALRELGFVESKAGRRPTAASYLADALEMAKDGGSLAGIHAVMGINLVDWGRHQEGLDQFAFSLEHARASGNHRREIFSLGIGARGLLAVNRLEEADGWLEDCLKLVEEQRWIAFRPWPVALLSESRLRQKHDAEAIRGPLEEAFALSCQLGDACWEGTVARSIALSYISEDNLSRAMEWLVEAHKRCVRDNDKYVAMEVEILASQAVASRRQGNVELADAFARQWLSLAARSHMDDHVARAAELVTRSRS